LASDLITGHLLAGTYESYGRHWTRFVAYCDARRLQSLPALPATVVCYIAHLSGLGTLQPQSTRVHVSAINKAHTDLGYVEPATGGLVAAVRRGWALRVHADPGGQTDQRVGLPAVVASRCLNCAQPRSHALSPQLLRAFVYVAFGFALMACSDTDIHLQRRDVELTPTRIFVRLQREKGRAADSFCRRLEIPRAAVPGLYDALQYWQLVQQRSFDGARRTIPEDVSFWRLADDSASWASSSAVCSAWCRWRALR
jgi:hypothetical protein